MLPKKGRRTIVVENIQYHYLISGSISIVIRNNKTGEIIKWYEDRKPKWKIPMKPSDVELIIKEHNSKNN